MTYSLQPGTFETYWKKILHQEFLKRIQRTAKHDFDDAEFHGPEGYGDQSPIRPINPEALTYEASDRIIELSKPKPDLMHECHKPAVKSYLSNKNGKKRYITEHMKKAVEKFSKPKQHLSTEKVTSSKTKQKIQKSKINKLSKPKEINQQEMCRTNSFIYKVKENALYYEASDRVKNLSIPKTYTLDNYWTPSKTQVSGKQVNMNRIKNLAKPKGFHPDHKPSKNLKEAYEVSPTAVNYHPKTKIFDQLSQPISRPNPRIIRFKSDAYLISPHALKAAPTYRVVELAKPITRD